MLALVAATWPVWLAHEDIFPQVPIVAWMAWLPAWAGNTLAGVMLLGLLVALASPSGASFGFVPRLACGAVAFAWLVLAAADYQRLQPWAWQGALLAVLFAAADERSQLAAARWMAIGIYLHSAVSKLDAEFLSTLGMQFASVPAGLVGLRLEEWPREARFAVALLIPLTELAAGLLLIVPTARSPWRWIGLGLAMVMHLALLLILGPLGLGHRPGVLIWNLAFLAQDFVLFWPLPPSVTSEPRDAAESEATITTAEVASLTACYSVLLAALAWPCLVFFEWCDPWPAWGLYSPAASRVVVSLPPAARERVPPEWQPFLEPASDGSLLVLRLDRAALGLLGAPLYPHARPQLGLAAALARRWGLERSVRAELLGPADRFSHLRRREELLGSDAIAAALRRFRLNPYASETLRGP
jgi:hypothetical protein